MPSIQFGGISSGLDTASIISALMDVERRPLVRLQSQASALAARKTAYDSLRTALDDLLTKLQRFTLTSAGAARSASSADPAAFTAVAASAAVPAQYSIRVDRVATHTRATSTAAVGTPADPGALLASAGLPGTVTSGTVGIVVDDVIVKADIDAAGTLGGALDAIAAAIDARLAAAGDAGAVVTASVVDNRVQLSVAGATADHTVRFGVAGDTSNALGLVGLAGQSVTGFGGATSTIVGSSLLGVVQASADLDAAGLAGLTSTTTGTLRINGVDIAYDTTADSLNAVLARINSSTAGIVASIDRTNDRIVLTSKTAGATALDIEDVSGNLAASLRLAPGTTAAQVVGRTAQVTVDGTRTVTSDTNTVTNAIDGVTMTLVAESSSAATLTIGVDSAAIKTALTDLVSSYNALADRIDSLTTHATGAPAAPLEGEATVPDLALTIRGMLTRLSTTITSGGVRSLADVGVTSGRIGAELGTTSRLSLDATKLEAALAANPGGVAALLGAGGGILGPVVDRIKALTGADGLIDASRKGIDDALRRNASDQARVQARIDLREAALERRFAALEAAMAQLQAQQSQVGAQVLQFNRRTE